MESSPKRRRLNNDKKGANKNGPAQHRIIDFEAPGAARISNASAFVLQADELLGEVRLSADNEVFKGAVGYLHRIRSAIEAIEPHDPISVAEASQKLKKQHGTTIPFPSPGPAPDAQIKLGFDTPKCNVVGSYVADTMVKAQAGLAIDLVAEMPRGLFQEKDFLGMRYFYRRAYFLAYIAANVRKELGSSRNLSFGLLGDNPLLPILEIKPAAAQEADETPQLSASYAIRVIPYAPQDLFRKAKLLPSCCSCRANDPAPSSTEDAKPQPGTPFYNSTLKAEETYVLYTRVIAGAKERCGAFSDACRLGRTWLRQRGFGGSIHEGGFGNFEWSILMALLLKTGGRNGKPLLSRALSSTELFKAMVQFLATTSCTKKPLVLGNSKLAPTALKENGPVVVDASTELNILFKMSPWSAAMLQRHSKMTVELLGSQGLDYFEPTFIVNVDQSLQIFDTTVTVEVAGLALSKPGYDLGWHRDLSLYKILTRAFSNRTELVHIRRCGAPAWGLAAPMPSDCSSSMTIGIVFDVVHMGRQMEYGPSAEEQQEADKFRKFWGERAELRRFKNGNILECVQWNKKMPPEICEEMVRYVLGRHFSISHEHLSFCGKQFWSILPMTHMDRSAFDAARAAFQTFESDIRNLDGLVLQVRDVSPVSPALRYSSVKVPTLGFHQGTVAPMDVVLSFEASSKWPENLVAIQHAKIEFLLDIGSRLSSTKDGISTYLGRENVDIVTANLPNLTYLDIVYPNGAVFRLRIVCDLEGPLLDRQLASKLLDTTTRTEAEECLNTFNWVSKFLPLHSQTMATHCTRMPSLSPTIRLVKHWFHKHMLADHFSEELIELFVLHVFLQPYPWRVPTSPLTGFFHALHFLSRWDWRDEPLIIDSSDPDLEPTANDSSSPAPLSAISLSDRVEILHALQDWRRRDPNMTRVVMLVATPHDRSGLAYAGKHPSRLMAMRMTRLATAASKLARERGTLILDSPAKLLFQPSLHDYDVLIHLSSRAVRTLVQALSSELGARHSQFKNLDDRTGRVPLPLGKHPVSVFVEELNRTYADSMIFFHGGADEDGGSGNMIAALWNPRVPTAQMFRIGLPYNFKGIISGEGEDEGHAGRVEINKNAILLEIARIGGDLVKKIEVVQQ